LTDFTGISNHTIRKTWDDIVTDDQIILIPYEFIDVSGGEEFITSRHQLTNLVRQISVGDKLLNRLHWVKPGNKKSWDNYHKKRKTHPEVFTRFYDIINQVVDQLKYIERTALVRTFLLLSMDKQRYTGHMNNFLQFLLRSSASGQCGLTALSESITDKDPDLENMFGYLQSLSKKISLRPGSQNHLLGNHNRSSYEISCLLLSTWKNIHKNRKQFNIPGSERWISARWLFSAQVQAENIISNTDRILGFLAYHFPLLYQHNSSDVVEARLSGDVWLSDGLTYMNNKMEKLKNDDENWPYPGELPFIKG
jgi:hypothetical protein